jgi:hypothetical protein
MASFLVAGCARNVSRWLEDVVGNFQFLSELGHDVSYFIVESDSSDDTVDKLQQLSENLEHFYFLSLGELRERVTNRIERLVISRNFYLEFFLENIDRYDYLLIADLDEVNLKIQWDGLLKKLSETSRDSVYFTSSARLYYDTFALRALSWPTSRLPRSLELLLAPFRKTRLIDYLHETVLLQVAKSSLPPEVEVLSAFGGLACYGSDVFSSDTRYQFKVDSIATGECEHVGLNLSLRTKARTMKVLRDWSNSGSFRHTYLRFLLNPILRKGLNK